MRLIRISLLCLLAAAALAAQDFENIIQRAVGLQQAGNYKDAANAYREALKLRPDDIATHVNLGVVLAHENRFDEAIAEYRAAENLLPGDPRIELNIALAYQKSGRLKQARDLLEKLYGAHPEEAQIRMLLADNALQLGDNDRVIALLEPVSSQSGNDLAIAYMLGMALLHKRRIEEAQVQLDRILRNGDTAEAHFLLGTRMFESGDYPAAVQELGRAATQKPDLPQLQSFYAQALLNTGDPDAAATAFRKELAANPEDYSANLGLGQILVARKQFADARPLLEHALESRPASPNAKLALAECLVAIKQWSEAQLLAEEAAEAMPKSSEVHQVLADIYKQLKRPTDAQRERNAARSLAAAADPGPALESLAPDFKLPSPSSHQIVELRDIRAHQPAVLVFGSYSCPNFRGSAEALKSLYQRYHVRASFLLVYIREAHATGDWQSTRNAAEGIVLPPAATYAEKQDHAAMCSRNLHLPFTAVVDGMDGAVEKAYNGWPSRVFVVGQDGRIKYSSRLTELEFRSEEMEAALREALR